MKEIFKKAFSVKSLEPFVVGISVILLLEFAIFPALTIANTFFNLLGGGLGVGLIIFLYEYVKKKIHNVVPDELPEGETELDYVNPEELKPKRKRNPKQFSEVKSEGPFIKTRKNK
jgi:hypothetical protein